VIGDTVNLASRLEGVNKTFGTKILISETTLKKTGTHFQARRIGPIEVKGKQQPITVFELVALSAEVSGQTKEFIGQYSEALDCFQSGAVSRAGQLFQELHEQQPLDGPTSFYLNWCTNLASQESLTSNWHIIKMTSK
jgi:adenylate cyclase